MSEGATTSSPTSSSEEEDEKRILTSLPYYDTLRKEKSSSFIRDPHNNLDVLVEDDVRSLAICHLSAFHSFSKGDGVPFQATYEMAAAMQLATHHLNVGDGSIIPELDGLNDRCKVRFTSEFFDTQYDAGSVLQEVTNQTSREGLNENGRPLPCAFIGAKRSSLSMPMSIITGLRQYVQVSASSTSPDLDDKSQFPLFARTVPSDLGNAIPIIRYFHEVLHLDHLAVINVNDAYGNNYAEGLRLAADIHAPTMKIIQFPIDDGNVAIVDVVTRLRESQYRYIFALVFTQAVHDGLLEESYRQGVAGTGRHNWYFGDTYADAGLEAREIKRGSPLYLAYRGTGMVSYSGGIKGLPRYDMFTKQMKELSKNKPDLEYLSSVFPKFAGQTPMYDEGFADPIKDPGASFTYEATALVGLSACEVATRNDFFLKGLDHYESLVRTSFRGITEDVKLFPENGSRDPNTTFFTVTNFLEHDYSEGASTASGSVRFRGRVTHGFKNGNWTQLTDFIQNDGTSNIAPDLPPVELDMNYVSPAVRGTALSFSAIAILMAIGFAYWTHANGTTRVVRASQPFFLHMICVGAVVLALSLIPMSIDHGIASTQGCTIACNSTIWLVSLGSAIIFAALYTKTYRINRILKSARRFQRIKVEKRDVIKPMMVLLGGNLLILALMTGLSPIQFELTVGAVDIHDRTTEIVGSCALKEAVGYIIALVVVNTGALCFALFQAWQARNLSTEFAESSFIFKALSAVLSLMFVGVPVLIIASDNSDAKLFVSSAIIFAFAISILLLMFVPKIRYEKVEKLKSHRNLVVSGMSPSASGLSQASQVSDGDESSSNTFGEKILTTQTAEELASEVARLQKRLIAVQKRSDARDNARLRANTIREDSLLEESKLEKKGSVVAFLTDSVAPLLEQNRRGDVDGDVESRRGSPDSTGSFSATNQGEEERDNNISDPVNRLAEGTTQEETDNLTTGDIESSEKNPRTDSSSPIPQPSTEVHSFSSSLLISPKVDVLKKRQEAAAHRFESIQQAMIDRQSEDTVVEGWSDGTSS